MSLFFKHLLQSIKRKPLQPFIMTLTLTLSVFMVMTSLSIKGLLVREADLTNAAKYGNAELSVSLNGNSSSRFMFGEDAASLLGDKCDVVGTYEVILSLPQEDTIVFAVASEFREMGRVFDLEFTEYGEITENGLREAALISSEFAEKNGLSVGDTLSVKLLSEDVTYTVQGISPIPYLGKYDVLVDIEGVVDTLASKSVIASAIGEDFKPSSALYINIKDDSVTVDDCIHILKEHPSFADKSFTDIKEKLASGRADMKNLNNAINISVILICVMAMAVSFCCFFVLADERHEENLTFIAAGAGAFKLRLIQYAEVAIYWLMGTAFGIALSYGLIGTICGFVGMRYAPVGISVETLLIAPLIVMISSMATVSVFIWVSGRRRPRRGAGIAPLIALVGASVALMAAVFTVPIDYRLPVGVALVFFEMLLFFVAVPNGIKLVSDILNRAADRSAASGRLRLSAGFRYALKNLFAVRSLHNVARLISVLVSVVTIAYIVVVGTHNYIDLANNVFVQDYVILGATERCEKKISECDNVQSVEKAYLSTQNINGNVSALILSVKDARSVDPDIGISELPEGKDAYISKAVSEAVGLNVGDRLNIVLDGVEIGLNIKKIKNSPLPYVCFNCEEFGLTANLLMPEFKAGINEAEGFDEIASLISDDVAVIGAVSDLLTAKTKTLSVYLACGDILWFMVLVFSLIGLMDCVYNNYRARREEFELFRISGMAKGETAALKTFEMLMALALGCLAGLVCSTILLPFLNKAMLSYGVDMMQLIFGH